MNKNELIKVNIEGKEEFVIDSREVAEMMEMTHVDILRYLEGYTNRHIVGIIPTLQVAHVPVAHYFVESSYNDRGREKKCYLCTKMGCELLGSKQQGAKGILFSAKYVERFNEMEKALQNNKPQLTPQQELALRLFDGGIDAITAHKELLALETKELNDKIEEQQEEIQTQQQEIKQLSPLAQTLIKRFEKGENIGWTDVTKTFNLKRGQVSKWAINNGYIYKNKKDVTNKGDIYFQRYVINGFKNICITPQGVQLIEQHLEEIKAL